MKFILNNNQTKLCDQTITIIFFVRYKLCQMYNNINIAFISNFVKNYQSQEENKKKNQLKSINNKFSNLDKKLKRKINNEKKSIDKKLLIKNFLIQ